MRQSTIHGLLLCFYILCTLESAFPCELGWISYDRSCYKYVPTRSSWHTARSECRKMGVDLVVIKDQSENDFLYNTHFGSDFWIGYSDIEKERYFKWVNTSECSYYENFALYEPNNADFGEDCVEFKSTTGQWNDVDCASYVSYVCEKQMYNDTTPPSYGSTCPGDVHLLALPNATKSFPLYWMPPTWTDDSLCPVTNIINSQYSPGYVLEIPEGVLSAFINVTYTATDRAGNSNTCFFRMSASNIQSGNKCKNGGALAISSSGIVSCACAPGFMGLHCEIEKDYFIECLNNGTFVESNDTDPYCLCPSGFSGLYCEINICLSNPCNNNGTCAVDPSNPNSHVCLCNEGFYGPSCEKIDLQFFTDLLIMSESKHRCLNGGSLVNSDDGNTSYCACLAGYTGVECEMINLCSSNPCKENEVCGLYLNSSEYKCFQVEKGVAEQSDDRLSLIIVVVCLVIITLVLTIALFTIYRKYKQKGEFPGDVSMASYVGMEQPSSPTKNGNEYDSPSTVLL